MKLNINRRRSVWGALIAVLVLAFTPAVHALDACAVIQREGSKMLASGAPSYGKVSGVVGRHVSVSSWAKSALGRAYNSLSSSQKSAYNKAFRGYLVSKATSLARRYPGRSLTVVRRNCSSSGQISSRYTRTNGSVSTVNWRVTISNGRVWISDVSVGGQSLRGTVGGAVRGAFNRGGYRAVMAELG